jgi:DNA (cytosine-5)-methyltransferase 1
VNVAVAVAAGRPPRAVESAHSFLSLCAGIGGLDLALEELGHVCIGQVDIEPNCRAVLAGRWPTGPQHDDVKTTADWWRSQQRPELDIIAAGFPCQPVSLAGRQGGTTDDRWLWPAIADTVRHLRPRIIVVENVPGLLRHGIGDVLGSLSALGYDARWSVVSAASVGAPHLRRRVFIVAANPDRVRHHGGRTCGTRREEPTNRRLFPTPSARDTRGAGWGDLPGRPLSETIMRLVHTNRWGDYWPAIARWQTVLGRRAPEPIVANTRGNPALSPEFVEWMMGFPTGWVADAGRRNALRMLGNAVVPQQAATALESLGMTRAVHIQGGPPRDSTDRPD